MDLNEKIDEIINDMDETLSKNEKIRYIYISLGKILSKDVDFFFSIGKKLGNKNYSAEQLENVYNQKNYSNKTICKSSAELLKMIFDKIGIDSKIIRTIKNTPIKEDNTDFNIHHYFLACKGDDDKTYFLTLTADLGNIQMGYQTKHFANKISYIDDEGNQVYEGEEIKNSTLSFEEIKKIDKKIKYLNTIYSSTSKKKSDDLDYNDRGLNLLKLNYSSKNNPYHLHLVESMDNPFYNKAHKVIFKNGHKTTLSSLRKNQLNLLKLSTWKCKLSLLVNNKITSELDFSSKEKDKYRKLLTNGNIDEWLKEMNDKIKNINDIDKNKKSTNFEPIILLSKLKILFDEIEKKDINTQYITRIIDDISFQFVDSKLIASKDGHLSSYYIAKKFESELPKILDCGTKTTFSSLDYGEQVDTIYAILENIFPEIKKSNFDNPNCYDDTLSPVKNRITTSAIKNRNTGEYSFLFCINGDDEYNYIYNPRKNEITSAANTFDIDIKYIIINNKLNPNIENIENIENPNISNKKIK